MTDFKRTDYGNCERLIALHGADIRYCPPRRSWLIWDGKRWAWDRTGRVIQFAKEVARSFWKDAAEAPDAKTRDQIISHARESEKAHKIEAIVRLARTEPKVAVLPDQLDSDPWFFNCSNGTLNLKTGELRPHSRDDLITKLSPVDYDPNAKSELWDSYLTSATGNDPEFKSYLQRVAGYALTGLTSEKKFFFIYGPTDTTKSTFISALSATLADYHETADFDTWCAQTRTGGNRGDLVRLAGARLVTSVEVAKGKRFDEAIMKKVTGGGDAITAAAKFEAEFTFIPQFKLILAANDPPRVREDDDPIWNRVRRIPFIHKPAKLDPTVRERLTDPSQSGAAILAWAMAGCFEWQKLQGLGSAKAVDESTGKYRKEMDTSSRFFDDCCVLGKPDAWVSRSELRYQYDLWCRGDGVRWSLGPKEFTDKVRGLPGVSQNKRNGTRGWLGIGIAPDDSSQESATANTNPVDTPYHPQLN